MNWFWINAGLWIAWVAYWTISARFTARTKSRETFLLRLTHLGPLAIAFFLIFRDPDSPLLWGRVYHSDGARIGGTILTALGLLFALWARVHLGKYWSGQITLKQGHELIRTGPYRLARHPIYSGFILAALGSAITATTGDAFLGFAILAVTVLVKIHREEKVLTAEFGDTYRQFKTEVAMIVTFVL